MQGAFTTEGIKHFAQHFAHDTAVYQSDDYDSYHDQTPSSTTGASNSMQLYDAPAFDTTAMPDHHNSMSLCISQETDILSLHKSWTMPILCLWLNDNHQNTPILNVWHSCSQLTSKCAWMHTYKLGKLCNYSSPPTPPCVCIFSNNNTWVGIDAAKLHTIGNSPQTLMDELRHVYYSIR